MPIVCTFVTPSGMQSLCKYLAGKNLPHHEVHDLDDFNQFFRRHGGDASEPKLLVKKLDGNGATAKPKPPAGFSKSVIPTRQWKRIQRDDDDDVDSYLPPVLPKLFHGRPTFEELKPINKYRVGVDSAKTVKLDTARNRRDDIADDEHFGVGGNEKPKKGSLTANLLEAMKDMPLEMQRDLMEKPLSYFMPNQPERPNLKNIKVVAESVAEGDDLGEQGAKQEPVKVATMAVSVRPKRGITQRSKLPEKVEKPNKESPAKTRTSERLQKRRSGPDGVILKAVEDEEEEPTEKKARLDPPRRATIDNVNGGLKTWICDRCHRDFSSKQALERHWNKKVKPCNPEITRGASTSLATRRSVPAAKNPQKALERPLSHPTNKQTRSTHRTLPVPRVSRSVAQKDLPVDKKAVSAVQRSVPVAKKTPADQKDLHPPRTTRSSLNPHPVPKLAIQPMPLPKRRGRPKSPYKRMDGVKAFACAHCHNSYTHFYELKRHQMTHH